MSNKGYGSGHVVGSQRASDEELSAPQQDKIHSRNKLSLVLSKYQRQEAENRSLLFLRIVPIFSVVYLEVLPIMSLGKNINLVKLLTLILSVIFSVMCVSAFNRWKDILRVDIPGFSFDRGNTVVIYFRPGCLCDNVVDEWLKLCISKKINCVVMTNTQSSQFYDKKKAYGANSVLFLITNSVKLEKKFSPNKKTSVSWYFNKDIVHIYEGDKSVSKGIGDFKNDVK